LAFIHKFGSKPIGRMKINDKCAHVGKKVRSFWSHPYPTSIRIGLALAEVYAIRIPSLFVKLVLIQI